MDAREILEGVRVAMQTGQFKEAHLLLDALSGVPSPRLWLFRADLYREASEVSDALEALRRAEPLGAADVAKMRAALMWSPIMGSLEALDAEWEERRSALKLLIDEPVRITDPNRDLPFLDFYVAYRGKEDRELRECLAQVLCQAQPSLSTTALHVAAGPREGAPWRIGFCSAHLKNHTIGRLNEALIRGLGAQGFEVVVARVEPANDDLAAAIDAAADEVIVLGRDLEAARSRLAEAQLDLLHYPDLGMDPFTTWLAFARLAPVQTVSWGHPITSGSPAIDAFLASEVLVPSGTEHRFTERVVRLLDPMVCWHPPAPPPAIDRAEFGFPEGRTVYLVPQTAFKLHPAFDAVLQGIVDADPRAVIGLLAPSRKAWQDQLEARLGLPSNRLCWIPRQPRERYLALLRAADVMLDPFPFGGGHTSLEGFAMGVPIVTWPTDQLRGRLTACWYRVMGLPDLVVDSASAYVDAAVRLATDPAARSHMVAAIASRTDRLFDRTEAVTAHATAFRGLLEEAVRRRPTPSA